ncbi:MAG: DUF5668 domain-containing protein [Terriglobales bacterium]
MNCAYHADQAAVAYCRTCGKALCANCTRPVRGMIYCEDCLGARMASAAPAASFVPPAGPAVPPPGFVPPAAAPMSSSSGPNPTVAGILAGVFPFGVGAVYTGQYAKGLAHLAIFGLLIAGCNASGEVLPAICGIGIAFFIVYQIIDAVRSARAIQAGLPAPDPYGLGATFGGGIKTDSSKVPTGAIILILLGVLFLLHTAGLFEYGFDRIWPVFLIALGGWLFARNYGLFGDGGDPALCRRRLTGPVILITVGVLWLLSTMDSGNLNFGRTWPVILLVLGVLKLMQRSGSDGASANPPYGAVMPPRDVPPPPPPPAPPETPSAPSEVNHG